MTPTVTTPKLSIDYSTINPERLGRRYKQPPTYHLSSHLGAGCAGEPPGHPSYFIRSVYTQHGNSPREGAIDSVLEYGEPVDFYVYPDGMLDRLYLPLPLEHPRVQAWILATFRHLRHCYVDEERPEYGRPGTLIYPVPDWKMPPVPAIPEGTALIPGGALDLRRQAARAEGLEELRRAEKIATLDNHRAVRVVRKWYPDFTPSTDLVQDPGSGFQADWWTRYPTYPTEDTCPGVEGYTHQYTMDQHGNCRLCGRMRDGEED